MSNGIEGRGDDPDLFQDVHFLATRAGALGASIANRELAVLGLRVRSYSVLSIICTGFPQAQKEIAEALLLDPSQVVMLVDDLESRGFVRRIPDPDDRRARLVTATAAGNKLYAEAKHTLATANRVALASLDDEEIQVLRGLLQRFAFGKPLRMERS